MAPEMAFFEKPSYRLTEVRPFISGDLAYAIFSWAMAVTVVSDKFQRGRHPVSMNGTGTAVLSRMEGQWKSRHLHTATARARRDSTGNHYAYRRAGTPHRSMPCWRMYARWSAI